MTMPEALNTPSKEKTSIEATTTKNGQGHHHNNRNNNSCSMVNNSPNTS
jgi:hypothetical protein